MSVIDLDNPPPVPPLAPEDPQPSPEIPSVATTRPWLATALRWLGVTTIVGAVALSGLQWRHIYADSGFVVPLVAAAAVGAVVAVMSLRFERRRPLSFMALLLALAAVLASLYRSDVADLGTDLLDSWKGLASTGLLIPTSPRFVLVPVLVAGTTSWMAAELFLRSRRAGLAVIAVFVAHGAALAYTVSQDSPGIGYTAGLGLLIASLLAIGGLRRPGDTEFADDTVSVSGRQLGAAVLTVAVIGASMAGLTAALGEQDEGAFDLRARLVRPVDLEETSTPLARVKAGLVDTDNPSVFVIELSGLGPDETVGLIPVALLNRFDGRIWTTGARFEAAGSRLPQPPQTPATGTIVEQTVTLTSDYPFRFLPQAGVPRTVTAGEVAWDPRNGATAILDPTLNGGSRIFGGEVAVVQADGARMLGPNPGLERLELNDDQQAAIDEYLSEVTEPDDNVVLKLQKIEEHLRSDAFGYNIDAPAGHSMAALVSFLAPSDDQGDDAETGTAQRVGFSEHSAAAFAVLARQLGVPSRVVVGYRLDEPLSNEFPEQIVSSAMIHAWPEVWFEDTGWVRFEPTNTQNETADQASRTPTVSSSGIDASRTDLPDLEEPTLLAESDAAEERSRLWWLVALVGLPLLYLLAVVGARRFRRFRRRKRSNDAKVVGAWSETQDRFMELGLPASPSLSVNDVVDELDAIDLRDVGDRLGHLADPVDQALYSPTDSSSGQATEAWATADAAIRLARKRASRRNRLRAVADPRRVLRH